MEVVNRKFRITFNGRPKGSLGHYSEQVTKVVEAESLNQAMLKAYETHEHIHGGVRCEELT